MTKRKQEKFTEQPNLKQFRTEIKSLTKNEDTFTHTSASGPKQSRKEKRKEARLEKKSRKNSYSRRMPIPTQEDKVKAKKEAVQKNRMEKKKKKLKVQKKKEKRQKARKKKHVDESKEDELKVANMWDDREIRNLEKKLGLDKRKKKDTLPLSFHNDGLDYILDVVDSEKLKAMSQFNTNEGDSDIEGDLEGGDIEGDDFGLMGAGSGTDDQDDELPAGFDDDDDDDVDDDDSDNDDNNNSDEDTERKQTELQTSKVTKKNKTEKGLSADTEGVAKKEKWEELADKIKQITDKKKKEKENKTKKKVTFNENVEEETMNDSELEDFDTESDFDESGELGPDDSSDVTVASDDDDGDENESDDFDQDIDNSNEHFEDDSANEVTKGVDKSEKISSVDSQGLTEDIYGRLRDASGNIIKDNKPAGGEGAYIPPARRLQMAGTMDEKRKLQLEKLQKQLKGLVNRVSEANMQGISGQIEDLYLSNSRADVNDSLVQLMSSACITPELTPDRLSMELMMLVAILHGNVGSEVGAVFLQQFVKKFDTLQSQPGHGKQVDNVLVLLAHLYNFKVVHSVLIFDILKILTDRFTERDIELILLLLKHVGFTLRKDNAGELKELILRVQAKASSEEAVKLADQSRVRFMLDIVMAIRNNNMRKIPNYDPEHLDHLRKLIRGFIRGGHFGDSQLHIGVGDLLRAEEQGKWWLVGSAWSGKDDQAVTHDSNKTGSVLGQLEVTSRLQVLARKQRMNTELRRNIFFVIMTSEDYLDAFEKLLRLGLKSSQQQEIVLVIIDCCVQEKKYNPFYAHLSQKFCEHHRTYQMSYQFTVWDRFKEIGQLSDSRRSHFAKLLTHLFASKALSLSVLKAVSFGTLEKAMVRLLKQIMTDLLEQPEPIVEAMFSRIAQLDKLKQLHEGLRLFLRHFLIGSKKSEKNPVLLERVEMVDRLLARGKSHVLL